MMADWKNDIKKITSEINSLLSDAKNSDLSSEDQNYINETRKIINQLNAYPSIYVHNYDLLTTLLSERRKKLKDIIK